MSMLTVGPDGRSAVPVSEKRTQMTELERAQMDLQIFNSAEESRRYALSIALQYQPRAENTPAAPIDQVLRNAALVHNWCTKGEVPAAPVLDFKKVN